MQLFVSYSSKYRNRAQEVAVKLRAKGHEVFVDKDALPAGRPYDDAIREAINHCDLFIFLISPEALKEGCYTLTELGYAKKRWPDPTSRVLPVMVADTDFEDIDPYLSGTLTILRTSGNFATEVVNAVEQLQKDDFKDSGTYLKMSDSSRTGGQPSVRDLVDELVELLSRKRKAVEGSGERGELSNQIDDIVRQIKDRFRPGENEVVAGAKLVKVIGVGNFGTVWEGIEKETNQRVAVKIFRLERLAEGQMVARFRRSIRAIRLLSEEKRLAKKRDPRGAVVRFHQEDPTTLAFSMDQLHGGNVEDVGRFGWTLDRKLEFMAAVGAAISYSHANGVIHRDIKPANIVLDDNKKPVITDFDIADIRWATSLSTTVEKGLGTPVFAAPEQLEDADTATESADVYSLGRLLYYLLLERSPGYQVEKDPSFKNLSGYPPAIVEIVRQATQFYPAKRFGSANAFVRAVEKCTSGGAAWRARWSRTQRWVRVNWALLSIVGILLSGASGFGIWQMQVATEQIAARRRAEIAEQREKEAKEQVVALSEELKQLQDAWQKKAKEVELAYADIEKLNQELLRTPEGTEKYKELRAKIEQREIEKQEALKARDRLKTKADKLNRKMTTAQTKNETPALSNADCQKSTVCKMEGRCTAKGGRCIATSNADCQKSFYCKSEGRCIVGDETCIAMSNSDCQKSSACRTEGRCRALKGQCVAMLDDDCRQSSACLSEGKCTARKRECIANSNTDCKKSSACRSEGKCSLREEGCVATREDDCKRSTACKSEGKCSLDIYEKVCVVGSNSDCEQSTACKSHLRCTEGERKCIKASNAFCQKSFGCKSDGKCTALHGRCVVESDADCQKSYVCKSKGMCTAMNGECI
jgi:tRNA A-37 threonylcarbamoyl transferase component Bud32